MRVSTVQLRPEQMASGRPACLRHTVFAAWLGMDPREPAGAPARAPGLASVRPRRVMRGGFEREAVAGGPAVGEGRGPGNT